MKKETTEVQAAVEDCLKLVGELKSYKRPPEDVKRIVIAFSRAFGNNIILDDHQEFLLAQEQHLEEKRRRKESRQPRTASSSRKSQLLSSSGFEDMQAVIDDDEEECGDSDSDSDDGFGFTGGVRRRDFTRLEDFEDVKHVDWPNIIRTIGHREFLAEIERFDYQQVDDEFIELIEGVFAKYEEFDQQQADLLSASVGSCIRWLRAMVTYHKKWQTMEIVREKLEMFEDSLKKLKAQRKKVNKELKRIGEKVKKSEESKNVLQQRHQMLGQRIQFHDHNMQTANNIMGGLVNEKQEWEEKLAWYVDVKGDCNQFGNFDD
eukprot:TRINITY_DN1912_c0_g2_i1.p1 TRINITY_DN1912_c0_g2~~TRINITY_DN1912_c0_g2_i1.p1  ORF type:complete len:332 (-),score=136.98 TRINITY_DN1912_c0_g2_i1:199-1155(-)